LRPGDKGWVAVLTGDSLVLREVTVRSAGKDFVTVQGSPDSPSSCWTIAQRMVCFTPAEALLVAREGLVEAAEGLEREARRLRAASRK